MLDTVSMESLRKKAGLGYVGLSYSLNIDADRWPVNCNWRRRRQKQLLDVSLSRKPWIFLNALQEIQVGHQKFTGKGSTRRFEAFPTDELLNGRPGWSFLQPSALLRMKQRSYFAFGQENDLYQWQQCPHLFEPGTGLFAILRFGTHNV